MSLRTRLSAYLVGLHTLLFVMAALLLIEQASLFVTVELLLMASLAGGFHLLKRALEPLGYTRRLHDLLQDQHYANRLAPPEAGELDELVALFNTLLATLHRERLEIGEQQGFLDRLLEATPSAVLVFDFDGGISLFNASAAALLGLEQARGKPLAAWLDGSALLSSTLDDVARARSLSLLKQLDTLTAGDARLLTDPAGRRYRAQRGRFFDRGFARDFLMVEELTAELESSERAAYEKLIRVLAHEVNNTVAATASVLDSLRYYASQLTERDATDFSTAIVAVRRRNVSLGEFIERFTRVVKMPAPELRPANLKEVVDGILWLNREQCNARDIRLEWGRCDSVPPQPIDIQLMEQALLNIVKNAIEAIDARRAQDAGAAGFVRATLENDGGRIKLSIIDSGGQLSGALQRQLFTPFVSTKKGGQGIGLMFVREVLNRHDCTYSLAPGFDAETRFDIWFPATRAGADVTARREGSPPAALAAASCP
ncbi:sensor histidine kinase [Massilia horti]|uniref:histidine kinase n=1 Tax=Massilia horti TaxID=2562153 RepID=A0A4Y9T105_9BURK|nr:ATP-binding protein [Massilia horti]TFW31537.1 sensor histidine kinase [Massilia horti]